MDKANEGTTSTKGTKRSAVPRTSVDELIEAGVLDILKFHAMVSEIDMKRHGKKFDQNMTNGIEFLAKAAGSLNRYVRTRKEKETYGTEEV